MAVTSRPAAPDSTAQQVSGQHPNAYHVAAVMAQIGSYMTTFAFLRAVMAGADLPLVIGISLVVEFVLTLGKTLLFRARGRDATVGGASVLFDTLLNAGGLWPYTRNIAATPTAVMLVQSLGLHGTMGGVPALLIALVAGYLLAVAPHRLWKAARGGRAG